MMEENQQKTKDINEMNFNSIRKLIARKQSHEPSFTTREDASNIITDFDHFPYKRFFRGVYNNYKPVLLEREAGYRPIRNNCYQFIDCKPLPPLEPPNVCFQFPCSTIYPCMPKMQTNESQGLAPNQDCVQCFR
jgi:hypothetical protein